MTASESLWAKLQRFFFPNQGVSGRAPASRDGEQMPYEILLDGLEPIEAWSVCTVCMNVDRTASVHRPRWKCGDCGSPAEHQQPIAEYFDTTSVEVLERNLREWLAVKGVRPAYKSLRSARFKCLMTLSRRRQSAPAAS
jgi:ribosomal protein S27AE